MFFALSADLDMLGLRNSNRLTLYMHSNKNLLLFLLHILLVACVVKPVYGQPATQKIAHRWVIGAGVNLRAEPNLNAQVLSRMALNTPVNLIAAVPNSKYCEVELITSGQPAQHGFTACEFLGTSVIKPREVASEYLADGKTSNPNYNPERAFWLKPSYEALAEYGRYLERQRHAPKNEAERVYLSERPKIPEFERMKEHLAKGVFAPKPAPFMRLDDIKTAARNLEIERLKIIKKSGSIESLKFDELYGSSLEKQSKYLIDTMGMHTLDGAQGRSGMTPPPKLTAFIESLALPTITSSYFQSHDEIAAPTNITKEVAARFQVVYTIQTKNYDSLSKEKKKERFGLWDVSEVIRSLTQPVIKNTLSRVGVDIQSETTHFRRTNLEYGLDEEVMCVDYEGDGFDFGDADPKISTNYALNAGHPPYAQPKKAGNKLMYFFTKQPLPQQNATVNVVKHKLNRVKTGFVAATEFHFDINSDGIPDIVVWEGTGVGPGHLDGPTKTDDAWYRIFFINIAGQWHLLGTDSFSYGCGC
jgi:hypothetical protein